MLASHSVVSVVHWQSFLGRYWYSCCFHSLPSKINVCNNYQSCPLWCLCSKLLMFTSYCSSVLCNLLWPFRYYQTIRVFYCKKRHDFAPMCQYMPKAVYTICQQCQYFPVIKLDKASFTILLGYRWLCITAVIYKIKG